MSTDGFEKPHIRAKRPEEEVGRFADNFILVVENYVITSASL